MADRTVTGTVTTLSNHSIQMNGNVYDYVEITADDGTVQRVRTVSVGSVMLRDLGIGVRGEFLFDEETVFYRRGRQLWGMILDDGRVAVDRLTITGGAAFCNLVLGLLTAVILIGLPLLLIGTAQLLNWPAAKASRRALLALAAGAEDEGANPRVVEI